MSKIVEQKPFSQVQQRWVLGFFGFFEIVTGCKLPLVRRSQCTLAVTFHCRRSHFLGACKGPQNTKEKSRQCFRIRGLTSSESKPNIPFNCCDRQLWQKERPLLGLVSFLVFRSSSCITCLLRATGDGFRSQVS